MDRRKFILGCVSCGTSGCIGNVHPPDQSQDEDISAIIREEKAALGSDVDEIVWIYADELDREDDPRGELLRVDVHLQVSYSPTETANTVSHGVHETLLALTKLLIDNVDNILWLHLEASIPVDDNTGNEREKERASIMTVVFGWPQLYEKYEYEDLDWDEVSSEDIPSVAHEYVFAESIFDE